MSSRHRCSFVSAPRPCCWSPTGPGRRDPVSLSQMFLICRVTGRREAGRHVCEGPAALLNRPTHAGLVTADPGRKTRSPRPNRDWRAPGCSHPADRRGASASSSPGRVLSSTRQGGGTGPWMPVTTVSCWANCASSPSLLRTPRFQLLSCCFFTCLFCFVLKK